MLTSRTGKYAAKCAKELGIDYGEAIVRRHCAASLLTN